MKRYLLGTAFLFIAFVSCKKESNAKSCWQLTDCAGNSLQIECDKTESEIIDYVNANSTATCKMTYKKQ